MRICRKIKKIFNVQLIDELPDNSGIKQFYQNNEIDYKLLQKHLIESHLQAFNYYSLLLQRALEAGCQESLEAANRGMSIHSRQIAKISGMAYFSDINAAAARLEKEGYLINDEPNT